MQKKVIQVLALLALCAAPARSAETGVLANKFVAWNWCVADGTLQAVSVEDKLNGETLPLSGDCFELVLGDGTVLKSSDFKLNGLLKIEKLKPEANSPVAAKHFPGKQLVAHFSAPEKNLSTEWRVILRDGSTYVRQELVCARPARTFKQTDCGIEISVPEGNRNDVDTIVALELDRPAKGITPLKVE